MKRALRRAPRLRVIEGAASVVVPVTSQGILDEASRQHAIATRMSSETDADPISQSWLGRWDDFVNANPWSDGSPPRGLIALVTETRDPLHVIDPTSAFQRFARFNARMQKLWDDGAAAGHAWTEPRPPDIEPGKSTSPLSSLESFGDVAIVVGLLWLLSRR